MKTLILNITFLIGVSCVASAAFMLSTALGLLTVGLPLIAVSIHMHRQGKVKR